MSEKLEFDFTVKNNQVDKALDNAIKKTNSFEKAAEVAMGVFGGNIATKAFEALADGFNMLISVGAEAIAGASENEIAVNNLSNALKRAGSFSQTTSDSLQQYAETIEGTSTLTAEAALESMALLQSLTRLKEEGLEQGVSAAADFAAVLGVDLESATRLMAKAANGNTEAFKRYGVEIEKGSTNTETFNNTIKALNEQFGGAANSKLNTYSGSLIALENSLGKILDPMGNIIVKNPELIGTFNALKDAIVGAGGEAERLSPVLSAKLSESIINTFTVVRVLADAFDGITRVTKLFTNTVLFAADAIVLAFVYPVEKVIDSLIAVGKILPEVGGMFENMKNPISGASDELLKFTKAAYGDAVNAMTNDNVFTAISDTASIVGQNAIANAAKIRQANSEISNSNKEAAQDVDDTAENILTARQNLANDLLIIEQQAASERKRLGEDLAVLELEDTFAQNELKIQNIYDQKVREAEIVLEGELLKAKAEQDAETARLMTQKANETFRLASLKAFNDKEFALSQNAKSRQEKLDEDLVNNRNASLSRITALVNSNNKELAAIGKAAALTQIAIDGPIAVTKALAAAPPPFNFALAAGVGAAVAAQAANVIGVKFNKGGFISGEGATMGPDTTVAEVRKGEMVLNADQQKSLFDAINNGGFGGGGDIVVAIDGREIARALRTQLRNGFAI